jgi:hypothetical protein
MPAEPHHHWLELASWAATVLLCGFGAVTLYQIKIAVQSVNLAAQQLEHSKRDLQIKSKRESIAFSIHQCEVLAADIIPKFDEIQKALMQNGYLYPSKMPDETFPCELDQDQKGKEIWLSDAALRTNLINALNALEAFAMYFTTDLADEEIAFSPAGLVFCNYCKQFQWFIGLFRSKTSAKPLYDNIVKLYEMWHPRLLTLQLDKQLQELSEKKQRLAVHAPQIPIGTQKKPTR